MKRILYFLVLIASIAPILFTLPFDVIDIDSAQYAEIVREMVTNNEYFFLRDNGKQYLDKPILTFWSIAFFFKLFGISNYTFRLPAILITLLSFYSIFRITYLISNNFRRSFLAFVIYATCPGLFAMVVDPKIDVYLTAYLLFIHHAYYLGVKKNSRWFYLMYVFIGLGFITKGPISLVIPAISIGGDILIRRDWTLLKNMRLIVGIPLLLLFPAIWSYILFQDFSWYGPHFFLWIQSFGRFYRKMYDQKVDPFYFILNFAWAFSTFLIPLIFYLVSVLKNEIEKNGFRNQFKMLMEKIKLNQFEAQYFVIPFWFFLFLGLISFSRYQLPQYIYWLLPAAAIFTSGVVEKYIENNQKNYLFLLPYLATIVFLLLTPFSVIEFKWTPLILLFIISFTFLLKNYRPTLLLSIFATVLIYFNIECSLYPFLLSYQPASQVGNRIIALEPSKKEIFTYKLPSSKRSYSFYSKRLMKPLFDKMKFYKIINIEDSRLVLVPADYLEDMKNFLGDQMTFEVLESHPSYKVATPKINFFFQKERSLITKDILLVRVRKKMDLRSGMYISK
ncbi:MAG: glycosyltransferase family 39 protein [Leptospiraceae bacterium]|nr:glycosyltransferase family 39 protein [Leptospiraceae bacterium]